MNVPRDVVELILKKLPIDLRLALKVPPNKVKSSDAVQKCLERTASIASHPGNLCWAWARVDGEPNLIKVISMRDMVPWLQPDGVTFANPQPDHSYITACRTKWVITQSQRIFTPIVRGERYVDITGAYRGMVDLLEGHERNGKIC